MAELSNKRSRAHSRALLVDLCLKYRDTIENKRTDAVSTRQKEEGWRLVATEFGAVSAGGVKREWMQLKHVCILLC